MRVSPVRFDADLRGLFSTNGIKVESDFRYTPRWPTGIFFPLNGIALFVK